MNYSHIIQSITGPPNRLDSVKAVDGALTALADVAENITSSILPFVSALLDANPGVFEACMTCTMESYWSGVPWRLLEEFDESVVPLLGVHRRSLERLGTFLLDAKTSKKRKAVRRQILILHHNVSNALAGFSDKSAPAAEPPFKSKGMVYDERKQMIQRQDDAIFPRLLPERSQGWVLCPAKELEQALKIYIAMAQTMVNKQRARHLVAANSRLLVKNVSPRKAPDPSLGVMSEPPAKFVAERIEATSKVFDYDWRSTVAQQAVKYVLQLQDYDIDPSRADYGDDMVDLSFWRPKGDDGSERRKRKRPALNVEDVLDA